MKINKDYPFKYVQFQRSEFACNCGCGFDVVDVQLLAVLQDLRDSLESVIIINSGCRCSEYNKTVGGSPRSQHVFGKAADIDVVEVGPMDVYRLLDKKYPDKFGIGLYDAFVHIDVRDKKTRWDKRTK